MSGAIYLFPPYAFMMWRWTTLPLCSGVCKGNVVCRGEAGIQIWLSFRRILVFKE